MGNCLVRVGKLKMKGLGRLTEKLEVSNHHGQHNGLEVLSLGVHSINEIPVDGCGSKKGNSWTSAMRRNAFRRYFKGL
jgi:hypothetical protein